MSEENIFGQPLEPNKEPTAPPAEEKKEEGNEKDKKGEEGEEKEETEEVEFNPRDIDIEKETDPEKLRAALKASNKAHANKDESMRNLRRLVAKNKPAAKTDEFKPLYSADKLILSKDLPEKVRDGMTDAEMRTHDELIDTRIKLNDIQKKQHESEQKGAEEAAGDVDTTVVLDDEVEGFVKNSAFEVAGQDTTRANKVIKEFNELFPAGTNSGLTEKALLKRVEVAQKSVGDYQPPKDPEKKRGGAVAKNSSSSDKAIDAIVDSVDTSGVKKPIAL